jgi:hypothetical protein
MSADLKNESERETGRLASSPGEEEQEKEKEKDRSTDAEASVASVGQPQGVLESELRKQAEQARDYAELIIDTVRESLIVLDPKLRIKSANESFYRSPDQSHI